MMKIAYSHLILLVGIVCATCTTTKQTGTTTDVLAANQLQPLGRYDLTNQGLELISSAVHFGFSFEGEECWLFANLANNSGHNYLQYELDGAYQKRIRIDGTSKQPIVIKAETGGKHTVWMYKATEATTGPVFIEKITGKKLRVLKNSSQPLIEFIGNSITCGAAADASEVPCGTGVYHDQHNAYYAYGPRVARALNANYILSSVSGIGVYRNWNSDGPTMPQVYEKTSLQVNDTRSWDFKKYTPKVISIALGTNDFSNGDGVKKRLPFDSANFVNNYIKFVGLVKSKYPAASIALLSSPMINGNNRTLLQNCLQAVKQNIDAAYPKAKPVTIFFFKPMQPRGCSGHPSVEDHALLAEELRPFFQGLLKN